MAEEQQASGNILATVSTVSGYLAAINNIDRSASQFYRFRGHADFSWNLSAGIMRPAMSGLLKNEKEAVRDIISVHPGEFPHGETMFDRLVTLQHYGLPSRLIDLTSNPLIALYFATQPAPDESKTQDGRVFILNIPKSRRKYYDSDAVSCVSNLANLSEDEKAKIHALDYGDRLAFNKSSAIERLIQFIRIEKPYFQPFIDPLDVYRPYFVAPKLNNRRIIAHSGSFLIVGLEQSHKDSIFSRDIKINYIKVSKDTKSDLIEQLNTLGINESTLFPEIEKAAGYIKRRYI